MFIAEVRTLILSTLVHNLNVRIVIIKTGTKFKTDEKLKLEIAHSKELEQKWNWDKPDKTETYYFKMWNRSIADRLVVL